MNSKTTSYPATSVTAEERAYERLVESRLFQTYRSAFEMATGVPVYLSHADEDSDLGIVDGNPFCQTISRGKGCSACGKAHSCLGEKSEENTATLRCFAGMRETAVPIRAGSRLVAFLRIGQVFDAEPTEASFEAVVQQLLDDGFSRKRIEQLRKMWLETQVVSPERYVGCATLLNAFALQLSEELGRFLIAEENTDPPAVLRAKQYINANLEEKITLDAVAAHVHVSPFYFCKIFKQATGMTLTEFVNRRRVERAKRRLLDPHVRVTEVAYDVGYQSLSQFNRSFLKYAGQSPTGYREQAYTERALRPAA